MDPVTDNNYPPWTCRECALRHGGYFPSGHGATFHYNICPICGKKKAVTQPRDYMHPKFKERIKDWKSLG